MDTTDAAIFFDQEGICNHCKDYRKSVPQLPCFRKESKEILLKQISKIKRSKKGQYDCVIGLSGGTDSTYLAYIIKKELGLNPLAVHMDNGWNSELSVKNVENIVKRLDIDLYTKILDWNEFRDLQLSFLKASTPDSEIPTDHAILATLYEVAAKHKIKYIISGVNQVTERIMPPSWSQGHWDVRYILGIYKKFTGRKLRNFPLLSFYKKVYYEKLLNIKFLPIFNYYHFSLDTAKRVISEELNWKDYGGKHLESTYTKFYQGYILPQKFGYDKRKGHLSNLICSKNISREKALDILKRSPIEKNIEKELILYVAKKFNISLEEFKKILNETAKSYKDYPNIFNTTWYRYSRKYIKPIYRTLFPLR